MNLLLRECALEHGAKLFLARKRKCDLLIALQKLQNRGDKSPLSEIDKFVFGDIIRISVFDERQIAQVHTTAQEEEEFRERN